MSIPNKEVSQEYVNAISTMNWYGVTESLESLWAMDADAVAVGVEKHMRKFQFFNIMMKILLAAPFISHSILHGNTTP